MCHFIPSVVRRAVCFAVLFAFVAVPARLVAQIHPLISGGVDVEPKGGGPIIMVVGSGNSVEFTVKNTRPITTTYTITCDVTGSVTDCTPEDDELTLTANQTYVESVTFDVGSSPGSGVLILYATGAASDSGTYNIDAVHVTSPVLAQPRQPDSVINRAHCVTGTAGIGAWSCGDGVITLETPGLTTLDRNRALTLANVSSTAKPFPLVSVNVTINDTEPPLEHLTAVLTVNDTVRTTATYVPWSDSTRQVVLGWDASAQATGAYPYTLTVRLEGGNDSASTSVSGLSYVVNRSSSPYGAGWEWLGVERLILNQPVNTGSSNILWVDGDGSSKLYSLVATNTWAAPHEAYQDTIKFASGQYTRTLRHGVQVVFDSTGRHIQTTNRATQMTHFYWGSATRLDSIQVPPSGVSGQTFKFHYTSSMLDSVIIPGVSGRDVGVTVASSLLTEWRWPDGTFFSFGYDANHRVDVTTDARGGGTSLTYGANGLLDTAKVFYGSGGTSDSAVTAFVPWEAAGYASGSSGQVAADTSLAVTTIFGPRVGVADNATFHVDKWGAPILVKDPLGVITKYTRGNDSVPALVTEIDFPNPHIAQLFYNGRGNLDTLVDSTWGGGKFPRLVTQWAYADTNDPDSPSQVTAPDGTVTHYHYNTLGLTDTMADPRGHVTKFVYDTAMDATRGQILAVRELAVRAWVQSVDSDVVKTLTDSLLYDGHGNTAKVIDPAGGITKYARDSAGRVTQADNPVGFRQTFTFDGMDRVTRKIAVHAVGDSSSQCDSAAFLCSNRILDALNPSGTADTTSATYTLGFLTQVKDPRGVPHSYRYDLRGLLVADIDEAGLVDSVAYDEGALITAQVNRTGQTLTFSYDVANRLTKWAIPARTMSLYGTSETAPADSVLSVYDSLGNLLRHSDRYQVIKRTYLENGSLRAEVDSATSAGLVSDSVRYGYDAGGRVDTLGFAGGDTVRYSFHSSGDLDSLIAAWKSGGSSRHDVYRFSWDSLGRRRAIEYPYFSMSDTLHYDALGTLRYLQSINSATTTANRLNVVLKQDSVDVMGRPLHQTVTCTSFVPIDTMVGVPCGQWLPSETFTRYNRLGELVYQSQAGISGAVPADTFYYDQSGNRIRDIEMMGATDVGFHRYAYLTASNRLEFRYDTTFAGGPHLIHAYVWDSAGSRTTEFAIDSLISIQTVSEYQYDAAGRMVGAGMLLQPGGTGDTLRSPNSCRYDADGRAAQPCGGAPVTLLGPNVVHDPLGNWRYIMAPGIDEPLLAIKRNPLDTTELVRLEIVSDGMGQLVAIADSSGFINTTFAGPSLAQGPWASAGITSRSQTFGPRRWTTDSTVLGAVSTFRSRQYDPSSGKWLQEDPAGVGGGVNLYEYNGSDPNTSRDLFGLCGASDTLPDKITVQVDVYCPNGTTERNVTVTAVRVKDPKALHNLSQRATQLQGGSANYAPGSVGAAIQDAAANGDVYIFPSTADGGIVLNGGETIGTHLTFRENDWGNIQSGAHFMNRPGDVRLTNSTCQVMGHEGVHLIQHALNIFGGEDGTISREEEARVIPWHC